MRSRVAVRLTICSGAPHIGAIHSVQNPIAKVPHAHSEVVVPDKAFCIECRTGAERVAASSLSSKVVLALAPEEVPSPQSSPRTARSRARSGASGRCCRRRDRARLGCYGPLRHRGGFPPQFVKSSGPRASARHAGYLCRLVLAPSPLGEIETPTGLSSCCSAGRPSTETLSSTDTRIAYRDTVAGKRRFPRFRNRLRCGHVTAATHSLS